jgi:hypothetical protein
MKHLAPVLVSQVVLLVYHQATTLIDLSPFNGVRHCTVKERFAEAGANAVLMSLAPIGYAFQIRSLMTFGVVYYFVLFAIEIIIWWIPYFSVPSGRWRSIYNRLLALGTSNFSSGDTLDHWLAIHNRLHSDTITVLPKIPQRVVPNLEHTILHLWTAITALITAVYFFG